MSYNTPAASGSNYGVVEVGGNIDVSAGVISIPQSVDPLATITFDTVNATTSVIGGTLFDSGNRVITSVTPTSGTGISLTGVTSVGPSASFTVNNTGVTSAVAGTGVSVSSATGAVTFTNTGVTSLTAGTGITLSGATGAVTVSASGTTTINTTLVTTATYTALATDDYIGVNNAPATTITLPTGTNGKEYIVKDESGALVPAITITGTGGQLIDGAATASILLGFGSLTFIFRGTQWHIV